MTTATPGPTARQQRVLDTTAPSVIYLAGKGGGKTWLGARWIADQAAKPGSLCVVVGDESHLRAIRKLLADMLGWERTNRHDMTLANESRVLFYDGRMPRASFEGVRLDRALIEADGVIDPHAIADVLYRRLGLGFSPGQLLTVTEDDHLPMLMFEAEVITAHPEYHSGQ